MSAGGGWQGGPPQGGYGGAPPPGGYGGGPPPGGYGGGPPPGGYGGGFSPPGGNPYAAPGAQGGLPGGFSAGEPIGFAWQAIKQDFGGIALPLIVGYIVVGVPGGIISGIQNVVQRVLAEQGADPQLIMLTSLGFTPVSMLVNAAVQGFMMGGLTSFALKVARGTKPEFGEIFSGGRVFMPMFLAALLYGIGTYVGMLLCIVPGIIAALGWWLYPALVVDRELGAMDALRESWRLTTGQKGNLFLFFILMVLVALLGLLACCVGVLVVGAIASLSMAFIYMRLTGEEPRLPTA